MDYSMEAGLQMSPFISMFRLNEERSQLSLLSSIDVWDFRLTERRCFKVTPSQTRGRHFDVFRQ